MKTSADRLITFRFAFLLLWMGLSTAISAAERTLILDPLEDGPYPVGSMHFTIDDAKEVSPLAFISIDEEHYTIGGYLKRKDNEKKADLLNRYFSSISTINDENHVVPNFLPRSEQTLNNVRINISDVMDILKLLELGKATGHDGISHHMLKYSAETISVPLFILFNRSLTMGLFPDYWKLASVMPSFKRGNKSLTSNYRPIAILSCVGKVFKRVVYKYLYIFFCFKLFTL